MENIITKQNNDRLLIKLTHEGIDQLLGAPILEDGGGFSIGNAVFSFLDDWNQLDKVECCCLDTTSTNTGCWQGAAVRLEQLIGRSLLYLPCRHHIAEVILRSVFERKVSMFKTFQNGFTEFNHERYKSGMRAKYVETQLRNKNLEWLKDWIRDQPEKPICRHDYQEFLELCLLFLGENLPHQ